MEEKRVAVVTEAGNKLAALFAKILIKHQYHVIIAASSECYQKLWSEKDNNETGYDLIETDFTSDESIANLKQHIITTYGKLDVLVNNAEIANGFGQKIEQLNMAEVKAVYDINLFAVIRLVQAFKPLLELSKAPSIINISSALGDITKMKDESFCYSNYCLTAYATSKAALNMFTHLQCKEFKPSKIKIHSFDPVAMKNCTYNSVMICDAVKDDFVSLITWETAVG